VTYEKECDVIYGKEALYFVYQRSLVLGLLFRISQECDVIYALYSTARHPVQTSTRTCNVSMHAHENAGHAIRTNSSRAS